MKEWKLIRKADGYLSMVYFQVSQPDFNPAFGEEKDFQWSSRDVSVSEYDAIKRDQFVEQLPIFLAEFLEAYHEKESEAKPAKMNALMQKISDLKASIL
jgi:hypothetical protein